MPCHGNEQRTASRRPAVEIGSLGFGVNGTRKTGRFPLPGIGHGTAAVVTESMKHATTIAALLLSALMALPALADKSPVRRGTEDGSRTRRGGIDSGRMGRRPIEGGGGGGEAKLTEKDIKRKNTTRVINLLTPPRCGARRAPRFRKMLANMKNPNPKFYVELWGNKQTFYVMDSIYYFLRANREAYVTMFWIGPEGSVFIPFSNVKLEANRDHKLDPRNIIVEPVGLERWRVIATPKPHALPCQARDGEFVAAIKRLQGTGPWAAGRWDVMSKVRRHRRRYRNR